VSCSSCRGQPPCSSSHHSGDHHIYTPVPATSCSKAALRHDSATSPPRQPCDAHKHHAIAVFWARVAGRTPSCLVKTPGGWWCHANRERYLAPPCCCVGAFSRLSMTASSWQQCVQDSGEGLTTSGGEAMQLGGATPAQGCKSSQCGSGLTQQPCGPACRKTCLMPQHTYDQQQPWGSYAKQ